MRLAAAAFRFLLSLAILVVVSIVLLRANGLPIAPHAVPVAGSGRFLAQLLGTLWWFAAAATVTLLVRMALVAVARAQTKNRRRIFFVGDAATIVSFLIATIALSAFVFELPITTLFATSSIIAVVLGFALQNTVADLLSGLAISVEQPFRIGDRIVVDDRGGGRVVEVNWRAARLLTITGDLVIIPNSVLGRARILNHDSPNAPQHRSAVEIKLGTDVPPQRATQLLRSAALSTAGVLETPRPKVEVMSFGDWAISYKLIFYFTDWGDETEITGHVLTSVWSHLSWAGVPIPLPRTTIARAADAHESKHLAPLLAKNELFAPLATEEREHIALSLRPVHVPAGTNLIHEGDEGESLFIVREGVLEVFVNGTVPRRAVARLSPGSSFGEASLLSGAPRNATVAAVTDAVVYELDKPAFASLVRARPEIASTLAPVLAAQAQQRAAAGEPVVHDNDRLKKLASQIHAFLHA
jgi:small-conductance mechanosensitive channel